MDTTRPEPLTDAPAPQASPRPRRWASELCELLAYLVLSVLAFLPQSIRPWDTVGYVGDSFNSVWGMGWAAQTLPSHPAHFLDTNQLYPHKGTLPLSPHRILLGILALPVIWASGNPVLAYNLAVYVGLLLAAVAGRSLARFLGIGRLGSWAAGALYAFHTYQINEIARVDLLYHGFTALAVLKLLQLLRDGRRRDAWWVALCMWLQGLASNYLLIYGVLVLGLVALGAVLASTQPRAALRRLLSLVAPALVAAACYLPMLLPQLHADRVYRLTRGQSQGIDGRLFFATSPANWLYGSINGPVSLQTSGPHFIGFVSLALAALALLGARAATPEGTPAPLSRRRWVPGAAVLAVLFASFCFGRDVVLFGHRLGPGPYRLLYALVPGFDRVRAPERLSLLMMLFVALLVGQGLAGLAARRRWRWLAVPLALVVPLEHLGSLATNQRVPVGSQVPEAYRWLAKNPVRALAELPADNEAGVRRDTIPEYFSLYHNRPMIHGYVSYQPLMSMLLRRAAVEFPSDMSLALFRRVGVDTILVHHQTRDDEHLTALLADSTARGDLRLLRVFEPGRVIPAPEVRAWPLGTPHGDAIVSVRDEIYRVAPGPVPAEAPQPSGRVERRPTWKYLASAGDPLLATDADPATRWSADARATYEVVFDEPCSVSGIVLPLDRHSSWPRRFLVRGQNEQGDWSTLAAVDTPHLLQVFDQLLEHPGWARLGIAWDARSLRQLQLAPGDSADATDRWRLSEIEVVVPEAPAP